MQIGVITDLSSDDASSEVPVSDQLMEVDTLVQEELLSPLSSQGAKEYHEVVIHADYPEQKVKIGRELSPQEALDLVAFL